MTNRMSQYCKYRSFQCVFLISQRAMLVIFVCLCVFLVIVAFIFMIHVNLRFSNFSKYKSRVMEPLTIFGKPELQLCKMSLIKIERRDKGLQQHVPLFISGCLSVPFSPERKIKSIDFYNAIILCYVIDYIIDFYEWKYYFNGPLLFVVPCQNLTASSQVRKASDSFYY